MCPVCTSNDFRLQGNPFISNKVAQIIKLDFKVVKCNNCSAYYVNPQINFSFKEWKYLYDETYFPPLSTWYAKKRSKDAKLRLNGIERYSSIEIKKFLDVGCGEGFTITEAEKKGWDTYGLDITDHRIKGAKKDSIKFINSDLLGAKLESDFFDAVYLDSVLEHVLNPLEYLNEIKRILRPGGILYIGVPNEDSLFNEFRKLYFRIISSNISEKIKPFQTPYHVIGFNKESLLFIISKVEFKVKKINNFASRFEFLKVKPFTKEFFQLLILVPIYLLAVPLNREVYYEAFIEK